MVTYGKKKKFALPKFLSDTTWKGEKQTVKPTWSEFKPQGYRDFGMGPSPHDDSIDEMASMLLEDTTMDQLKADPGKRLSQIAMPSTPLGVSATRPQDSRPLPQLPSLPFNEDNAWALDTASIITATSGANAVLFNKNVDNSVNLSETIRPTIHTRDSSAPPIPRKSSKRKFAKSNSIATNTLYDPLGRKSVVKSVSTPNHLTSPIQFNQSASPDANEVNVKIEQMLRATEALKGNNGGALIHESKPGGTPLKGAREEAGAQGSLIMTAKQLKDYNILSRVKTVISDRLQGKSSKKLNDSSRDGWLLDRSLEDLEPDISISDSTISDLEISTNERKNLRTKVKSQALTGYEGFPRKPLNKTAQKVFDLTNNPFISQSQTMVGPYNLIGNRVSISEGVDTSTRLRTPPCRGSSGLDYDFNDRFSSSPVAQSTPRIRVDRSYDVDNKTLGNVPTDLDPVFDLDYSDMDGHYSDMELYSGSGSQAITSDTVKRKSSHLKIPAADDEPIQSKRVKKHPSPSKQELEIMEIAMNTFGEFTQKETRKGSNDRARSPKFSILASIDPNKKILETRQPLKREMSHVPDSLTDLGVKRNDPFLRRSSTMRMLSNFASSKAEKRQSRHGSTKAHVDEDSMDIDELQLDDPVHNIGAGSL